MPTSFLSPTTGIRLTRWLSISSRTSSTSASADTQRGVAAHSSAARTVAGEPPRATHFTTMSRSVTMPHMRWFSSATTSEPTPRSAIMRAACSTVSCLEIHWASGLMMSLAVVIGGSSLRQRLDRAEKICPFSRRGHPIEPVIRVTIGWPLCCRGAPRRRSRRAEDPGGDRDGAGLGHRGTGLRLLADDAPDAAGVEGALGGLVDLGGGAGPARLAQAVQRLRGGQADQARHGDVVAGGDLHGHRRTAIGAGAARRVGADHLALGARRVDLLDGDLETGAVHQVRLGHT